MADTKEIRKELKAKLGYNARQTSVSRSGGGSIRLTIRSPEVDFGKVKEFGKRFEHYTVDQGTGCILRGGNTFVFVTLSDDLRKQYENKYKDEIAEVFGRVTESNLLDIPSAPGWMAGKDGGFLTLWDESGFRCRCTHSGEASVTICIG